jgi:hypothetical protein
LKAEIATVKGLLLSRLVLPYQGWMGEVIVQSKYGPFEVLSFEKLSMGQDVLTAGYSNTGIWLLTKNCLMERAVSKGALS